MENNKSFEEFDRNFGNPLGCDEAGRGPLAGPVVSACVFFDKEYPLIPFLNDSKKMTEKSRIKAEEIIRNSTPYIGIAIAEVCQIDKLNILYASLLAMREAVYSLKSFDFDMVLVDGNKTIPDFKFKQQAVVKGDAKSFVVACASVIAKNTRDRIMKKYDDYFPQYGFSKNKGYPTKEHYRAIEKYGISCIHRKTFNCVKIRTSGQQSFF